MMGRRPDSTLGKRKIVIGMLTAVMMSKQIVRHFQACKTTISSLKSHSHIQGFGPRRATVHPDLSNRGASA